MTDVSKVNKKIFGASAMLFLALLMALPMIPIVRASGASVQIVTGSSEIGQPFSADVQASGVADPLVGYDITVRYDPTVLSIQDTSLGNSVFDLNHDNSIADEVGSGQVLVARADVFQGLGFIRYALVLTGGNTVAPSKGQQVPIELLSMSLVGTGMTAPNYPAALSLTSSLLAVLVNGNVVSEDHTAMDGSYMPPANANIRSVGCRATIPGLNVQAHGTTEGLFCRVINDGSVPSDVVAMFQYHSVGGASGAVFSLPMTLAPGQMAELDASLIVPASSDVYLVQGSPVRIVTFPDSSVLLVPGPSSTFKFNVNVCTNGC